MLKGYMEIYKSLFILTILINKLCFYPYSIIVNMTPIGTSNQQKQLISKTIMEFENC